MREKLEFPDEKIIACLQKEYGLQIVQINFLPLGGDLSTAIYQGITKDARTFFCKMKRDVFDETTVELPKFLSEQGIAQIIPPITTLTGHLWTALDEFTLILYPFIEGQNGFEVELTARQWTEFGTAIQRIHTTHLPTALARKISKENYSPARRDAVREIFKRLDTETFDHPIAFQAAEFLRSKREIILDQLGRAERLAILMVMRLPELVLCHSDIHPGNLFLDPKGPLFIVDWDYPILAPKECDLMFIGGGQGFVGCTSQEEETFFSQGYGPSEINPNALAYYRYERNIYDLSVECERVLSSTIGDQNRAFAFEILQLNFMPDCPIEMAYKTDKTDDQKF